MATARELLEQADALMRRNRERAADDIPVLTDAVPSIAEAGLKAEPLARAPSAPSALDDVPLLTDRVEEIEALSVLDAVETEGEPSDWLDFGRNEASVIGDAPDSIAIVPPVDLRRPAPAPEEDDEVVDTGTSSEPSAPPAVDEIEIMPAPAVDEVEIMPAPAVDEVEIVPPPAVDEVEIVPPPAVDEVEIVPPPEEMTSVPSPAMAPALPFAGLAAALLHDWEAPPSPKPERAGDDSPAPAPIFAPPPDAYAVVPAPPGTPVPELIAPAKESSPPEMADAVPPAMARAPSEIPLPLAAEPDAAAPSPPPPPTMPEADFGVIPESVPAEGTVSSLYVPIAPALEGAPLPDAVHAAGAGSGTLPSDPVQWEAMAEEIRMQVLQRIDLFTDTGLRAQLGARLQPIVDRASADLVATINQHVGELLRAYVAEAIEREIDSWRRNH